MVEASSEGEHARRAETRRRTPDARTAVQCAPRRTEARLGRLSPPGIWASVVARFTGVPAEDAGPHPPAGDQAAVTFTTRLSAEISRRPALLFVAALATVLGPAVVVNAGSVRPPPATDAPPAAAVTAYRPPPPAPGPGDESAWRDVARAAATTCPGLPTTVLVAIGRVESGLGIRSSPSSAGAEGPMQFLPATWAAYGTDGDGDGRADVMNAADALHGAARLLCANGGGDASRLRSALWDYNHSVDYVARVLAVAASEGPA